MLHRIKSMLTDFSGNEGAENAIAFVGLLIAVVILVGVSILANAL